MLNTPLRVWVFVIVSSFSFLALWAYLSFFAKPRDIADYQVNYYQKKADSLQNIIINYEKELHEERQKRLHLYAQKDSLQNIITDNAIYLPDLQRLKRTK